MGYTTRITRIQYNVQAVVLYVCHTLGVHYIAYTDHELRKNTNNIAFSQHAAIFTGGRNSLNSLTKLLKMMAKCTKITI